MRDLLHILGVLLIFMIIFAMYGDDSSIEGLTRLWDGILTIVGDLGEAWRGNTTGSD